MRDRPTDRPVHATAAAAVLLALVATAACEPAPPIPFGAVDVTHDDPAAHGKALGDVTGTTATVGAAGGSVPLAPDGWLDIPAGAFAGSHELSVEPRSVPDGAPFVAVGPFFALGPPGTRIVPPAEIVLPYHASHDVDRLSVVVRAANGGWHALPTRVDAGARVLVAQLGRLDVVGPAAWDTAVGACCGGGSGCVETSAALCDGVFLGRGVACDGDGDGTPVCARLGCCATDEGHRFVVAGTCRGAVVAALHCELVCCAASFTSPVGLVVPHGDCPAGAAAPATACRPLCCTFGDRDEVRSLALFEPDCRAVGEGLPLVTWDARDDCPVCCADGWSFRAAGACLRPRAPHECVPVCCETEDGRARMAAGACRGVEGRVVADPACACDRDLDCDDASACTADRCEESQCVNEPLAAAVCGDGCVTPPETCEHDLQCGALGKDARCVDCRCEP